MLPSTITKASTWKLIPNAIAMKEYRFDSIVRRRMREQLGLEGKFVVGHVGRFSYQTNQDLLIDVFEKIMAQRRNAVLVMDETGDLLNGVKEKVSSLALDDRVFFLGQRKDVSCLMHAMDVFAFPSKFEGFGIEAVEAQAAGLPVIMGDWIPRETNISTLAHYLPSTNSAQEWAGVALIASEISRQDMPFESEKSGFDVIIVAKNLYTEYIRLCEANSHE